MRSLSLGVLVFALVIPLGGCKVFTVSADSNPKVSDLLLQHTLIDNGLRTTSILVNLGCENQKSHKVIAIDIRDESSLRTALQKYGLSATDVPGIDQLKACFQHNISFYTSDEIVGKPYSELPSKTVFIIARSPGSSKQASITVGNIIEYDHSPS